MMCIKPYPVKKQCIEWKSRPIILTVTIGSMTTQNAGLSGLISISRRHDYACQFIYS